MADILGCSADMADSFGSVDLDLVLAVVLAVEDLDRVLAVRLLTEERSSGDKRRDAGELCLDASVDLVVASIDLDL